MFGLAYLDDRADTLLLARDPFGIKPLYHHRPGPSSLLFASDIPALLRLSGEKPVADRQQVRDFLQLGLTDHDEQTFVSGISAVPPGHGLQFDLRTGAPPVRHRYWRPAVQTTADIGFDEAVRETRQLLDDSVALHCTADTEVSAALSGGLDSSAIVASMARLLGPGVPTYSYAAPSRPVASGAGWSRCCAPPVRVRPGSA